MSTLETDAIVRSAPVRKLRAVTPNDTVDLPDGICRAIWVGGAGDVEIIAGDDSAAVVIAGVPAGTLLPIQAKRVLDGNTDATLIVAFY